jgi:uncharacterized membrane protein
MTFIWDPVTTVNLVLCIIILVLGVWGFNKKRDQVPLYIGMAFGLFGISHLMTILDLKDALTSFLVIIRVLAYLIIVFTVYKLWKR